MPLRENFEKYGNVGPNTYYNIIRFMRFMCWIPKAKNTHSV